MAKKHAKTEPHQVAMTERLELLPVADLVPYARNARTHSAKQIKALKASIQEFGFVNPVLIDSEKGIVAGHGRVMAAKELGMETVPCVYAEHLTETQKRAYILADNRLAEMSGWDDELVQLELGELSDLGFDLGVTGFEIAELPDEEEPEAAAEDIPESETKTAKTVTCPECGCQFSPTKRRK